MWKYWSCYEYIPYHAYNESVYINRDIDMQNMCGSLVIVRCQHIATLCDSHKLWIASALFVRFVWEHMCSMPKKCLQISRTQIFIVLLSFHNFCQMRVCLCSSESELLMLQISVSVFTLIPINQSFGGGDTVSPTPRTLELNDWPTTFSRVWIRVWLCICDGNRLRFGTNSVQLFAMRYFAANSDRHEYRNSINQKKTRWPNKNLYKLTIKPIAMKKVHSILCK